MEEDQKLDERNPFSESPAERNCFTTFVVVFTKYIHSCVR